MSSRELFERCDDRWLEILMRFCSQQELIDALEKDRAPEVTHPGARSSTRDDIPYAVQLIMRVTGWSLPETLRRIKDYLEGQRDSNERSTRIEFSSRARPQRSRLLAFWNAAVAMDHEAAEPMRRYFVNQGLAGIEAHAPNVRCHRSLEYFERNVRGSFVHVGDFPALLAPVSKGENGGELVGLQAIYLTATGDKAPVIEPEELVIAREIDNPAGAAIRLFPAEHTLGVTLGLETACAVKLGCGMPVWATSSLNLLVQVELPPFVRQVFNWVNVDPPMRQQASTYRQPEHEAGEQLVARLCADGQDAYVVRPYPTPTGRKAHWIDVYRERGAAGFPPLMQPLRPLPTAFRLTRDT